MAQAPDRGLVLPHDTYGFSGDECLDADLDVGRAPEGSGAGPANGSWRRIGASLHFGTATACGSLMELDASPVYFHGRSEAWITSGTPCPPTDLIARSTSFS